MDKIFSIRTSLQGELFDFVKKSGFSCPHTMEFVRDLTCLLASYREEDVPVFPDVFVMFSNDVLASISPGTQPIPLGETILNAAATKVLKNCARLAVKGWAIYVIKIGENMAKFGVFRSQMHSFATTAEETMLEDAIDPPAVILIRNRGRFVVEVQNGKNDILTVSFTSDEPSKSSFVSHVSKFAFAVACSLPEDQRKKFHPYLARLLTITLQHSHGTLLAAHEVPAKGSIPKTLSDGIWLATPIDFAGIHQAAIKANDAQALATLQSCEALLEGMVNSDGVVVFGTDGSILGYRVFLKPNHKEKKRLPEKGGGRRRTYALMQGRVGNMLKAVFFLSQDGETDCESVAI